MGDIGDYWREHKEYVQTKKNNYRSKADGALAKLSNAGIDFRQLSHGHYRISLTNDFIDYWPSTGKWRSKDGKATGYEVSSLIKEAKKRISREATQ